MRDGGRGFPGESTRLVCRQRHRRVQRVLRAGMSSCVATWHCPRHGMTHDDIGRRHGASILTTPRRRCSPMPSVPPCRAMWRRPQFHACDGFIRCGACRHHARQPPSQGASLLLATPSRAALLSLLAFGLAACCSPPHLYRPPPPVPFGHDGPPHHPHADGYSVPPMPDPELRDAIARCADELDLPFPAADASHEPPQLDPEQRDLLAACLEDQGYPPPPPAKGHWDDPV